jgi:3-methylfumaryl-CoA hydratase
MDQVNFSAWVGRTQIAEGVVQPQTSALVQATLGDPAVSAPSDGDCLPPLWHWYAFPPTAPMTELGRDGHPKLGGFLPPVRLERRMWAGGALTFHASLHVGEALTRRSRITAVSEKTGAAGDMVFVTVAHEIHGAHGLAVSELQDIVYLAIPESYRAPKPVEPPAAPDISEGMSVTEALLFRYSAITFNAHRIHYDLNYTQQVEHYPGLVVHGPMQANLLMDLAVRHRGRAPSSFSFRGVHPMFCPDDMRLLGVKENTARWSLCTATDSHQGMQATATWEETDQ